MQVKIEGALPPKEQFLRKMEDSKQLDLLAYSKTKPEQVKPNSVFALCTATLFGRLPTIPYFYKYIRPSADFSNYLFGGPKTITSTKSRDSDLIY